MNIYIICSVRDASNELREDLESYTAKLERAGHNVHLPHRDTKQGGRGIEICKQNVAAIENADEVHVFYCPKSQGSHFDLGAAFALRKSVVIVGDLSVPDGKSFQYVLTHWPYTEIVSQIEERG